MKSFFKLSLFPRHWIANFNNFRPIAELENRSIWYIVFLSTMQTIFEGVGISLIVPFFELLESEGAIPSADTNHKISQHVISVLIFLGLPVKFYVLSTFIALLIVLRQSVDYLLSVEVSRVKVKAERCIRRKIFNETFSARPEAINELGAGSYIELMVGQVNKASNFLTLSISYVASLLLIFCYALIAFYLSFTASLVAFFMAILAFIVSRIILTAITNLSKKNVIDIRNFAKHLSECFLSWKMIKLSNSFEFEQKRNDEWVYRIESQDFRVGKNFAKVRALISITILSLLITIINISFSYKILDASFLVLLSVMTVRLLPNLLSLVVSQGRISVAGESVNRIFGVINDLRSAKELDGGTLKMPPSGDIVFNNVSFSYPGSNESIFHGFNARIPAFRYTAIKGESGVGKSTLIDLLSRISNPSSGSIYLNNVLVDDIELGALRKAIAIFPQNPVIFDDTVKSNIAYGKRDVMLDEVIKVSKIANAHDFIMRLPNGYDTVVGERGNTLSGGQIQRIALARVLATNAKILVFDEPSNSLDAESNKRLLEALMNIKRTKRFTVIMISHSRELLDLGDQIIEIKKHKDQRTCLRADVS